MNRRDTKSNNQGNAVALRICSQERERKRVLLLSKKHHEFTMLLTILIHRDTTTKNFMLKLEKIFKQFLEVAMALTTLN